MGRPDNTTMLQTKKSARQIYAEAFMEDEQAGGAMTGMGGGKRIYADIEDDAHDHEGHDHTKIVKPEDDEAEEEAKVENLDDAAADHHDKHMDDLLGGGDEEHEEGEEENLYEDLDIPEGETPVEFPEDLTDESKKDEWKRLGY